MYTISNEMLLNEAANIVTRHEKVSVDRVFARYNVECIFGWRKVCNDQHLGNMDTILQ